MLAYGAWRLTDSTEHPTQILLECVADGVPIGHCDASLTPNVVSEAVASLPDIADKGTVELINKLPALMPIGYVQHLTGVDANNQRLFVNTEPVANSVDATWLSLPASSSGRSSFPLYIVSVSSEPSLAKTLAQSLGRNPGVPKSDYALLASWLSRMTHLCWLNTLMANLAMLTTPTQEVCDCGVRKSHISYLSSRPFCSATQIPLA